jgi:hypothetical protein
VTIPSDIELADAVAAWINGQSYSVPMPAERLYSPEWDVKDELDETKVGVWTSDVTSARFERTAGQRTVQIGITIAKRVAAVPRAVLDALLAAADEVITSIELQGFAVTDGMFVNDGSWESLVRGGGESLQRKKTRDGSITYTGFFASITTFTFLLVNGEED